jgi:hypothetical protein
LVFDCKLLTSAGTGGRVPEVMGSLSGADGGLTLNFLRRTLSNGDYFHAPDAGGRRAFRPPDPLLESQDGSVYFGARSKIHIINLEKTLPLYLDALNFIGRLASKGGKVLLVGTKRSAREATAEAAIRCWHALCQSPLARRHADQFQDRPAVDQAAQGPGSDGPGRHLRPAGQERSHRPAAGNGQAGAQSGRHQGHGQLCRMRCS